MKFCFMVFRTLLSGLLFQVVPIFSLGVHAFNFHMAVASDDFGDSTFRGREGRYG